jgi:hypothetical protein
MIIKISRMWPVASTGWFAKHKQPYQSAKANTTTTPTIIQVVTLRSSRGDFSLAAVGGQVCFRGFFNRCGFFYWPLEENIFSMMKLL